MSGNCREKLGSEAAKPYQPKVGTLSLTGLLYAVEWLPSAAR